MNETRPTHAVIPAILLATFHGMLWIVLLGMMLKFVPAFVQIFKEFDAELPAMTQWTIRSSDVAAIYWFVILPVIVVLWVVDLMVLRALYVRPQAAVLRWLWLTFMLLVPLGLMAWTVLAMCLPVLSLTQQLR